MFTAHENIEEFYDWWKQQDHKNHTCADMVLFTLCKAYWKNPEMPNYEEELKRAFKPHKHRKYNAVVHSLEWLYKYSGLYANVDTFKDHYHRHEFILKSLASIMANGIDKMEYNQEASNGA